MFRLSLHLPFHLPLHLTLRLPLHLPLTYCYAYTRSVDPTAVPHRMQWAMREPLDAAFVPTGHLASRVSGIPDDADDARREMAWRGVSNYHRDPKDAWRRFSPSPTKSIPSPTLPYHPLPPPTYDRFGVPIIYVPRISPRARRDRKYVKSHALPSSDLILCEGKDGGRAVRIVTCTDGWVCIVNTHYEVCMHSGSFPVGPEGVVDPSTTRPYLECALVPGVELLRAVCYSLATVDRWCMAVQAAHDVRGVAEQEALVRETYAALDAPLDERFRMLHPWLAPKPDECERTLRAFGERPRANSNLQ